MINKTYLVEGMTCNHCKARVEKSIKTIVGVEDVTADPASGQVKVSGNEIDGLKVKEVVEDAGYSFMGEA
jgi:copper chaperone CopZ